MNLLLLALAAAAFTQAGPLLDRPVTVAGREYRPEIELYLPGAAPVPGLYRRIEAVERASITRSRYPAAAFADAKGGWVRLSLVIDDTGRLTGCTVTQASAVPSIDADACPHVRRHMAFHPALDEQGGRRGGTVPATLHYFLSQPMIPMPTMSSNTPPFPLETLTLDALGFEAGSVPAPNGTTLRAALTIDATGRVLHCTLTAPTYDDRTDKRLCDRLRQAPFSPARARDGSAVESRYSAVLALPE